MAKGHWGKKAVLASLVISVGLLSGQEVVRADEKADEAFEQEKQVTLQLAKELSSLFNSVSYLNSRIQDAEHTTQEAEVLRQINKGVKEELAKITKADVLSRAIDEMVKYKDERDTLQSQLTEEEKALTTLKQDLETTKTENKEEKAKTKQLSQDLKNTTQQLSSITNQFRLTVEKDEADKKKLEAERDAIKTQLTDSNKAKTELEAKMKALQTQTDETAQNLQAEVEKGQDAVNKLTSEKQAAETQVAALTAEKEQLSKAKAEVEAQLQDQNKLSEADKAKLQAQLADVQAKITEKENAIKGLE
ncbi:MAG: hypothetical protein DI617_06990, partial [Streptococcus pyogenes]